MAGRILECRKLLYDKLRELGTPGTWEHVVNQKGMFGFTGLSGECFSTKRFNKTGSLFLIDLVQIDCSLQLMYM